MDDRTGNHGEASDPLRLIDVCCPGDLRHWAIVLGTSVDQLLRVVRIVGPEVQDVRSFLANGDHRAAPAVDRAPDALTKLEARVATLTHQIMGMERMLAGIDSLGAETARAEEAITAAYQLLTLYRRRLEALIGK